MGEHIYITQIIFLKSAGFQTRWSRSLIEQIHIYSVGTKIKIKLYAFKILIWTLGKDIMPFNNCFENGCIVSHIILYILPKNKFNIPGQILIMVKERSTPAQIVTALIVFFPLIMPVFITLIMRYITVSILMR